MKKSALIIGFVFAFAIFANAQVHSQISVQILFDFYVQNQKLTAGDYLIESSSPQSNQSALIIREKKSKTKRIFTINPISLAENQKFSVSKLIFNRYGNEYFLAEICNPSEKLAFAVRTTKTENNFAKKFNKPTQETIAVNIRRK